MPRIAIVFSVLALVGLLVSAEAALAQDTTPAPVTPAAAKEEPKAEAAKPAAEAKAQPAKSEPAKPQPKKDESKAAAETETKSDTTPGTESIEASEAATPSSDGPVTLVEPDPAPVADEPPPADEALIDSASRAAPADDDDGSFLTFGKVFKMSIDGKVRARFTTLWPNRFLWFKTPANDRNSVNPGVGRNDGFVLADARINLAASYKDLYVRLGFDGSFVSYEGDGDTVGAFDTGLKDAYLRYSFADWAHLSVGRFKPPFDTEELMPTQNQFFVHRALESRGVDRQEGHHSDMPGLRQGRHLGLMVASPDVLGISLFEVGYALAITNGNRNGAFNDNDLPAIFARVTGGMEFGIGGADSDAQYEGPATYGIREGVFAGLSFMYNEVTPNDDRNRQRDRVIGVGADISASFMMFTLQGQILWQQIDHLTFDRANIESALGGHMQLSVEIPGTGLAPGYRFAAYDPRMPADGELDVGPDSELVQHHSIGLRWKIPDLPLVSHLEYTHSAEQSARAVANDRLELAVQVTFE